MVPESDQNLTFATFPGPPTFSLVPILKVQKQIFWALILNFSFFIVSYS